MGLFDWLSLGLDFIPIVGELKAFLELISGKDTITKEDLKTFDRVACGISLIPLLGKLSKISNFIKQQNIKKNLNFFLN